MAYDDYEDRETSLDRGAELYDDDMYDMDEFGERLDNSAATDETQADDELLADDATAADATPAAQAADSQLEDNFNETLSDNPHIDDQLGDTHLSNEAESDYAAPDTGKQDESIIDKAKDKLNDLTGHNK